jgi:hypothetical protein
MGGDFPPVPNGTLMASNGVLEQITSGEVLHTL